jgi:hypothetical protein
VPKIIKRARELSGPNKVPLRVELPNVCVRLAGFATCGHHEFALRIRIEVSRGLEGTGDVHIAGSADAEPVCPIVTVSTNTASPQEVAGCGVELRYERIKITLPAERRRAKAWRSRIRPAADIDVADCVEPETRAEFVSHADR